MKSNKSVKSKTIVNIHDLFTIFCFALFLTNLAWEEHSRFFEEGMFTICSRFFCRGGDVHDFFEEGMFTICSIRTDGSGHERHNFSLKDPSGRIKEGIKET